MGDTINALSLVIAIYAFVTALLLFVAQTENYNRISHYWMQKGKRAWMVIFNSSRRHLISNAFHKPLSFKDPGLSLKDVRIIGNSDEDDSCTLEIDKNRFKFVFDYLAPKSAIVAEFNVNIDGEIGRPELNGVLKGGRLVKCYFWFDDPMHLILVNLFGYIAFCVLVIGGLLYLRSIGEINQGPFAVYTVGVILLALGVYFFFRKNRRFFVKDYKGVRRIMRNTVAV